MSDHGLVIVIGDHTVTALIPDHAFIYSAEIRLVDLPSAPAVPSDAPPAGRWIEVNLTQQVVVAYDGRALVRMARTSTGRPAFETTPGTYVIQRRVASETMTSAGVIGKNGQVASYSVPHVRWTRYFSSDGQFLWDWAVGTPVVVHA
ncbi:MAG: L,D-transpeptidase [Chloroflexota bacterium]|nr:L,D-transpeptidase [Chloroflexota bacterium]